MNSIFEGIGPGAYQVEGVDHLKKSARATIGKTKRILMETNQRNPGPDIYNPHKRMTDTRCSSRERNAPRCTFGNELKSTKSRGATPGPTNYNTESRAEIGKESSVKVPFTTAVRPISAHPGQTKKIHSNPGPQDYGPISVDKYRKRRSVIPKFLFSTSSKELEGVSA